MAQNRKKTAWYLAMPAPLLAGMIACQAVAAVWVGLENRRLHDACLDMLSSGWQTVPNAVALPGLLTLSSDFNGGLFYTFTVGAGLAMLFFLSGRLLFFIAGTGRAPLTALVAAALALVVFINQAGFVLFPSLMVLLCCLAAILLAREQARRAQHTRPKLLAGLFVAPIIVLAASWAFVFSNSLFDHLRDDLLLKSRAGIFINDFYYSHTLSAANCFKSLKQKKIVPVFLEGLEQQDALRMERSLARYDWLSISQKNLAACVIQKDNEQVLMNKAGRAKVEADFQKFLFNPGEYLSLFSQKTDKHAPFRRLIYFCLLFGFPLALYTFFFSLVRGVSGIWAGLYGSWAIAALCCTAFGLAALWPMLAADSNYRQEEQSIQNLLESEEVSLRVAGLRRVFDQKQDLCRLAPNRGLERPMTLVEKRWLAMALAHAKCPQASKNLLALSGDEQPNVRSLAVYSLAMRGNSKALGRILEMIQNDKHWYAQEYAYNAARGLGWTNQRP
ncbi:MAG: HEAT repeat domain-containing protein [Desulfatibacillaceae bacterium]|nr:HEAT repeat domain-containing protein [Desulfatibacillaceae bacterium]